MLSIINKSDVSSSCITYFYYPKSSIKSVHIECLLGDCEIIQESIEPLKLQNMTVSSSKAEVNINLINLEANTL